MPIGGQKLTSDKNVRNGTKETSVLPKAAIIGLKGRWIEAFAVVQTMRAAKQAIAEFKADGLEIKLTSVAHARKMMTWG